MVQEHAILLWCDIHNAAGEAASGRTITVNGRKMEICPDCENKYSFGQVDEILGEHGRTDSDVKKPNQIQEATDQSLKCPHGCNKGKPYKSYGRLDTHMNNKHGE